MKVFSLVLSLGLLFGCSTKPYGKSHKAFHFGPERPIVAAHRAEHSVYSENSLEAIQSAQRERIPLIEIDIRESLDGELFLFHNTNVDPHTVKGPSVVIGRPFSALTSSEIKALILPNGEKIPSFDAVLKLGNSAQSSLLLDIKGETSLKQKVLNAVREHGEGKTFWFLCYDLACIQQVRAQGISGAEVIARQNRELSLDQALLIKPRIIQISCENSCSSKVTEIKSRDSSVLILATALTDALDNKANWRRVREEGVDIILTDKPLKLKLYGH